MSTDSPADGTTPSPDGPIEITGEDALERLVAEHDPVLVDFYADWCGPCKMLEPIVESIAADTPATVGKLDVDAHPAIAGEFGVRGVPTLVLFAGGEPVERLVGMHSEDRLRQVVDAHT